MVFDVLSVDGGSVAGRPYRERRRILEDLQLDSSPWRTAADDGNALAGVDVGGDGRVVARARRTSRSRRRSPVRPRQRSSGRCSTTSRADGNDRASVAASVAKRVNADALDHGLTFAPRPRRGRQRRRNRADFQRLRWS
jgi:hypothetical protein